MDAGNHQAELSLARSLSEFNRQNNGSFTDFSIRCCNQQWPVHRLIVSLHSKMLSKVCNGSFKESLSKEIDLSEDHPLLVGAFVHFMYDLKYQDSDELPVNEDENGESCHPLAFHIKMAIFADQYEAMSLFAYANQRFRLAIDQDDYNADEFASAAVCAYDIDGPTTEIRQKIVDWIVYQSMDNLLEGSAVLDAMQNYPQLAIDVATQAAEYFSIERSKIRPGEMRWECPNDECGFTFIADLDRSDREKEMFSCYCMRCGEMLDRRLERRSSRPPIRVLRR